MQGFQVKFEPLFDGLLRLSALNVLTAVALMAAILLVTSEAHATCGDYLSEHGMLSHFASHDSHEMGPLDGIPRHLPCHGPSCRRQAPVELPPSVPVISLDAQDRWVWVAHSGVPAVELSSLFADSDETMILPMIANRLDRPPRI